jgi:signal transduction histidine kinase
MSRPTPDEALAFAFGATWGRRQTREGSSCFNNYTLVWTGDNALVAGPQYKTSHWTPNPGITLSCRDENPPQGITRYAAHTGLPWNLTAALNAQPLPEFASRRIALLSSLPAILLLIIAAAYFAWRSISRELGAAHLQSDFVSSVSHEFRTPLTSLRQFNEMLVDGPDLPRETRMNYYLAQGRATDRLSRLVEKVLDFGRMEAGRRPYHLELIDAAALVREVCAEFAAEPAAREFAIDCAVPVEPLPVDGDAEALSRALWNLLDNAVKYSGKSRRIRIEAAANGSGVAIRVVDHGLGIPRNEQARLFQRFVRGQSILEMGIPGTGIGLAMVRHIAEAHRGRVDVASTEGQGSTFSLLLPGKGS